MAKAKWGVNYSTDIFRSLTYCTSHHWRKALEPMSCGLPRDGGMPLFP